MLTFANAALLAGLGALALPPIIHFFSRKKIDEMDWAAMQFLAVSTRTRRRIQYENLLLMLLRMLAIALLVLALAAPVASSTIFSRLGWSAGSRDVVLLIDGSASMQVKAEGESAAEAAHRWARQFIAELHPGDRVAIFQARRGLVPILPSFSDDLAQAANALELLPPPRGTVDWPACMQDALRMLENARPERDLVIVTDGQRHGWADEATMARWELGLGGGAAGRPRIRVANIAPNRPAEPFNLALDPIITDRGVASEGREVRFRTSLRTVGRGTAPNSVRLAVNGKPEGEIRLEGSSGDPVRPATFSRRFPPGSHLVTITCEGDDLTDDNRQDYALEVLPALPVLIVDGSGPARRGEFLRDALAPARDDRPAFLVKIVTAAEFGAELLTADVRGRNTPPRAIVLANVPSLTAAQNAAIEHFLANGGSVLVTLGEGVEADAWNRVAFRGGQGWLPARVVQVLDAEAQPMLESFIHPAVQAFQSPLPGGLHTARFPKRWLVDAEARAGGAPGTVAARFSDREAFLVDRAFGRGRVLLSAVPLDNSWGTNLVSLPDFVRLAHESLYYLCGARSVGRNLSPGQPIVFAPSPPEPAAGVRVVGPDGSTRTYGVSEWPLVIDDTQDPGAYLLTTASGRPHYFAVRSEAGESRLEPASADDLAQVADRVPGLKYIESPEEAVAAEEGGVQLRDLWRLGLVAALLVLLGEGLFTRRLAAKANREA